MEIKKFANVREFAENRKLNRIIYSTMTYEEKRKLKEYIYNLNERTNRKDLIWEYLNEPIEEEYYVSISLILGGYVRSKDDKNSNRL